MGEDRGIDGGIFDGGDDRQEAAAMGVVFQVDLEHPFEQSGGQALREGVPPRVRLMGDGR